MRPARKGGGGIVGIERHIGGKAIEAAAAQERELVDQHVTHRAQFAGVACLAQDPRRRIAAPVAEDRKVDFDQRQPVEEGNKLARIVARLNSYRGGVGLVAARIDSDRRMIDGLVGAEAKLDLVGPGAQVVSHTMRP